MRFYVCLDTKNPLPDRQPGRLPAVIVSHGFAICTRDTKKYAQVFVDEGYAAVCIPDDARRGQMINAKFDPNHVPDQFRALFVKLSSKYALDVIDMDSFQEICVFQKPVLIIHGTKDKLVDIRYSRRACEGYKNCSLVEVNGGHGFIFGGFAQSKRATQDYLRAATHASNQA